MKTGESVGCAASGIKVAVSPDSRALFSMSGQDIVKYDITTGKEIKRGRVMGPGMSASWEEISPDGRTLALAGQTHIVLVDTRTLKVRKTLKLGPGQYSIVGFTRRGELIAITRGGAILRFASR